MNMLCCEFAQVGQSTSIKPLASVQLYQSLPLNMPPINLASKSMLIMLIDMYLHGYSTDLQTTFLCKNVQKNLPSNCGLSSLSAVGLTEEKDWAIFVSIDVLCLVRKGR